jgi:hypothetical protein
MDYTGFKEKARQNLTVAEWCYPQGHYTGLISNLLRQVETKLRPDVKHYSAKAKLTAR